MRKKQIILSEIANQEVIGIVSNEKHHRLAWFLNRTMGLNFAQTDDIVIESLKSKGDDVFSVFESESEENGVFLRLISNKNTNNLLVPRLKDFDFFIILTAPFDFSANLTSQLRKLPFIVAAYLIENKKINSKLKKVIF